MTVESVRRATIALALVLSAGVIGSAAGPKVRAERDKTFDFKGLRSWAWHPTGAGDVRMALTANDDPKAVGARFEPVIKDSVQQELAKREISPVATGQDPHIYLHYYLLVSSNVARQSMGQFLPSVTEWGLPPFSGATQDFRVFPEGSVLIDVTAVRTGKIIWRGMVSGEIALDRSPTERDTRLRAAIAALLKKFPSTS